MTEGSVNNLIIGLGFSPGGAVASKLREVLPYMPRDDFDLIRSVMAETAGKFNRNHINDIIAKTVLADGDFNTSLRATMVLITGSDLEYSYHVGLLQEIAMYPQMSDAALDLGGAPVDMQQKVCGIASAVYSLRDAKMNRVDSRGRWVKVVSEEGYFNDRKVLDALVRHADRADEVAALYLERGNVDAVDSVMLVSRPLTGGAL